ncbi:MAG: hypothetical protein ACK4I8_08625, partial [Armatimonadota bacterium]
FSAHKDVRSPERKFFRLTGGLGSCRAVISANRQFGRLVVGSSANRQMGSSASRQFGKSADRQFGRSASRQIGKSADGQIGHWRIGHWRIGH